jgi:uncharacterized membrane protein
VENAAERALKFRRDNPYLGGSPLPDPAAIPDGATPVFARRVGYVQHVDMAAISEGAEDCDGVIYLVAMPGKFVDPHAPLAHVVATKDPETLAGRVVDAITVANERTFDQDPRFGLCVLAEIASRALSPGLNDPGTAIDVIGRAVRLLWLWAERTERQDDPRYPSVHVPPITPADMMEDLFIPIARDGATIVEVQIRLQKAFASLARSGDPRFAAEALRHSALARARAEDAMSDDRDIARVREAALLVT